MLADGDDELVVMPRPGVLVPPLVDGLGLRVTGEVRTADGEPVIAAGHVDYAAPPGLASRVDAVPVADILDDPAPAGTVFVRGEVQATDGRRFLL